MQELFRRYADVVHDIALWALTIQVGHGKRTTRPERRALRGKIISFGLRNI